MLRATNSGGGSSFSNQGGEGPASTGAWASDSRRMGAKAHF